MNCFDCRHSPERHEEKAGAAYETSRCRGCHDADAARRFRATADRGAVKFNENRAYASGQMDVADALRRRADAIAHRLASLYERGFLDPMDVKIIAMRQESPMPSNCQIAKRLGVTETTIRRHENKFPSMFSGL